MVENLEQATVRVTPDGRLSRADAATFLGRAPKTLAMWAVVKTGPTPIRVGGRVFYKLADLQKFAAGGVTQPRAA